VTVDRLVGLDYDREVPTPTTRTRRHAPAEQRRAQIVEAALACFADKGYRSATMDDIVRASGLSKGSLYWHFRSKEEVFLAVFDAFADEVFSTWDALLDEGCGTLEVLDGVVRRTFDRMGAENALMHAWAEFLSHPRARDRLAEVYRRTREKLVGSLQSDVVEGRVRDLPLPGMAAALTAAVEGMGLQAMLDEGFDLREHWPVVREMVRRGLEP
jgi:AcrR family transcriptional regulator